MTIVDGPNRTSSRNALIRSTKRASRVKGDHVQQKIVEPVGSIMVAYRWLEIIFFFWKCDWYVFSISSSPLQQHLSTFLQRDRKMCNSIQNKPDPSYKCPKYVKFVHQVQFGTIRKIVYIQLGTQTKP